jgi:predicted GIY-YIG superfamily endonuclease
MPRYQHRKFYKNKNPLWNHVADTVFEYNSVDSGIYILECEEDKFYVGQSKDMMRRMIQHRFYREVKWLKKFPPTKIFLLFCCDVRTLNYWEKQYVRAMVWKKGISNCRGGPWTRTDLCMGKDQKELEEFYIKNYSSVPKHFGSRLL